MNKSWCPLPWNHLSIRNNGDYRLCAHANVSKGNGIFKKEDGQSLNTNNVKIDEVRNCQFLKDVRKAMLNGERHESCQRCNIEDDSGVRSRRSYERTIWADSISLDTAKAMTKEDGEIKTSNFPVRFFDIRFGNLCNLKCRMCSPKDSSGWYQEHADTISKKFVYASGPVHFDTSSGKAKILGEDAFAWHEKDEFWIDLESKVEDIEKIHTAGGEPLLITRCFDLLKKIVEAGRADKVILNFNSNITTIPRYAYDIWSAFKEVQIGMSVDGVGRVNDYIRHPSKWEKIEKNLNLLDQSNSNLSLWITATVQIYNVFYLPEFLQWKIEADFKRINQSEEDPFLTLHPLYYPAYLSIQILPVDIKIRIKEKFDQFYQAWFLPYLENSNLSESVKNSRRLKMEELLGSYVNLMFKEDKSYLMPEFWKATHRMDKYRGESFSESLPEFATLLSEAGESQREMI